MNVTKTIPRDYVKENLITILLSMGSEENKRQELIFSVAMIQSYCEQWSYDCYRFAHDLDGQLYMRARIHGVTLEFITMENHENDGHQKAYAHQIFWFGERIYRRPDNPVGTIYII